MKVTHSAMNSISAENFMRSAKAPTISAGVIIAKVIWKHDVDVFRDDDAVREGRATSCSASTPLRKAFEKPPTKSLRPPPLVKARQ